MKTLKKLTLVGALLLAALSLSTPAHSQPVYQTKPVTLLTGFDLDGEAADADQIVTAANGDLLDSKTFTVTASPDVCRLVDMTVTDLDSSITDGVLTVVGTDCLDNARTCSFTFAGGGSGVKSLACTDNQGAYFKTVDSVTTGALTGEGGAGVDLMTLGYTSNSVNAWAMWGTKVNFVQYPNVEWGVNPFLTTPIPLKITTSGAASTTVTSVASNGAFTNVSAGDLLSFTLNGVFYERKVTARASADSITVDQLINIPAAGTTFNFKKLYYSSNPYDVLSIPVSSFTSLLFVWSVDANANTGGVITLVQCTAKGEEWPNAQWVQVDTVTVASASTQAPTAIAVDLYARPYTHCRFGLRFGTGDDGDGADEDINLQAVLLK